jgi:hypothetical protein
MKKEKKQCQCDGLFARMSGLVMAFVGGLGLVLTFVSKGLNKAAYLHTEIQGSGVSSSTFENEMSWEVVMMLSLSVALIVAGIIIFIASRKISEN